MNIAALVRGRNQMAEYNNAIPMGVFQSKNDHDGGEGGCGRWKLRNADFQRL
jgi:hypothetical protein